METATPKRRWFRYSLRTLLVLVTLSAVVIGWYTHRQRVIKAERAKLLGRFDDDIPSVNDTVYTLPYQLSETDFTVGVPDGNMGTIDFPTLPGGRSKGIYRFDGDQLVVAQNHAGKPRPTTFDADQADSCWVGTRPKAAKVSSQTGMTRP